MAASENLTNSLIMVTREGMGTGDLELQRTLFGKYLRLLLENGTLPAAMCFYTEGVKLVVEGSPVLELLAQLEAQGVRLLICSTCLNYYGLADQVRVGIVGGMGDILEAQCRASKVITL